MRTIDCSPEAAEDLLVALGSHLPPEVKIGRPLVAVRGADGDISLLTDTGVWGAEQGCVWRLADLAGGGQELGKWWRGTELLRVVRVGG